MFRRTVSLVLLLFCAGQAQAQSCDPSFRLINSTGLTMRGIYTRGVGQDGWSYEHLGPNVVLSSGYTATIRLSLTNLRRFDLRMVFFTSGGESEQIWGSVPLCDIDDITVTYQNGQFRASMQ